MIRIFLLTFLGLTIFGEVTYAQQLPISQQNYFNNFSLQPAYTGYKEGLNAFASFRTNMLGYSSSPNTVAANFSYRDGDQHGFGASLMTDQAGLIRNNMLNLSSFIIFSKKILSIIPTGFSSNIVVAPMDNGPNNE